MDYTHKCKRCGKTLGNHKHLTLACPIGTKTSVGYTMYSPTDVFEPVKYRNPKPEGFKL